LEGVLTGQHRAGETASRLRFHSAADKLEAFLWLLPTPPKKIFSKALAPDRKAIRIGNQEP
jgi:hypothetical protein